MLLSGIHAPNAAFTLEDYHSIDLGRFRACKVMHYHNHADVVTLRSHGVQRIMVRLPDSVFQRSDGTQYIPSYSDYGDALIERALYFYQAGVREGQVDNEPNISWRPHKLGPWDYRAFMFDVLEYIRPRLPLDYRLGFPSVSFADQWMPMEWLAPQRDLAERFDFLCVNSYWQSGRVGAANILAGPMTWSQFGGNCAWYETWLPGKPIQIAEYGNSIHEQGGHTDAQLLAFKMEQYPLYLRWLSGHSAVEAAYCFIAPGATNDWAGFRVTPQVAAAMGAGMPPVHAD